MEAAIRKEGLTPLLLALLTTLTGCANVTSQPQFSPPLNETLFAPVPVADLETFNTQNDNQRSELARFISRPDIAPLLPFRQVERFLGSKLIDFGYEGKNLGASEALSNMGGNCMSLALVTQAVAMELGVPVRFQLVHAAPVLLDATDDLIVLSSHVRTLLFDAPSDAKVLSPYFGNHDLIAIDYFPSNNNLFGVFIDDSSFIAMFYRNLASDALIAGDLGKVRTSPRTALAVIATTVQGIQLKAC
ncbi:hypothetical protein [Shewanella sp.]|uniref:hypothetical protein n=1 Tax=Shewanella sp. TaxID=50422 RepID=UPI0035669552